MKGMKLMLEDLDELGTWQRGWPPKEDRGWYVGFWSDYGPSCFRWNETFQVFATDSGEVLDKARAPDFHQLLNLPQ